MEKKPFLLPLLMCVLASCTAMPNIPPTSIITHTHASTLTLIPSATPTAASAITPSPTPNPYHDVVNSPNGKFSARIHISWDNPYDKPVIEVWDQTGSIIWKIPYQGDWDPFVAPQKSITIYGWSPDNSKLYFYYSLFYDTGVPTFAYVRNLQSLDIDTGKIKNILPISSGKPTAFAFSPDMNKIAYISGNVVVIFDLIAGSGKSVNILTNNFDDAGWIFYSPSGNKIVYHTQVSEDAFAIILEPQTMKQKIIYKWANFSIVNYTFDGWTSDEYPRYLDYENNVSTIDLNTLSQTIVGTATPKP